jgi:hypothetical protein
VPLSGHLPYHNSHLSGRNANADITPYVVASPEVEAQGVNIGDPAEIHFPNGNIVRCHVMDTGPSGASPGEMSVAAAHAGGYSTVDVPGVGPVVPGPTVTVTVIYYPSGH